MFGVTQWGRQIKVLLGLPASRRYTVEEVHRYLRGQDAVEGSAEIQQMIERLPMVLSDPKVRRQYEGFQRYVEVLPRIIFLYHRGMPPQAIVANLSFLATEVGIETVIWITSQIVADLLNRAA